MTAQTISGIKYFAFDLYGTLLTSNAGGLFDWQQREQTLRSHLAAHDIHQLPNFSLVAHLENLVAQDHAHSRESGIDFPEVEIREIWARFFKSLNLSIAGDLDAFIISYEQLINPIAIMPGAEEVLRHPFSKAIISNAQFYTAGFLEELGLPTPEITHYSYQEKQSKPGTYLFEKLAESLPPSETLYVGNDRLKDITPAVQCGFRTALFAGDQHSFRPHSHRQDLPQPDATITELTQIFQLCEE